MTTLTNMPEVAEQVAAGALFAVCHSGGKDSQALLIEVLKVVPAAQVVVVHADLGSMEWGGTLEHARDCAAKAGVPFITAKATDKAGNEFELLDMVARRFATAPGKPSWPSPAQRQCTSDLKRGPMHREVGAYAKAHGYKVVVFADGRRAAESTQRRKTVEAGTWAREGKYSSGARTGYTWMAIAHFTTEEVFASIAAAGQQPHPAYAAGNERLSCMFCIMGSKNDLRNAAVANPDLYERYVATEKATGYTMFHSESLTEKVGFTVAQAREMKAAGRRALPVVADDAEGCDA